MSVSEQDTCSNCCAYGFNFPQALPLNDKQRSGTSSDDPTETRPAVSPTPPTTTGRTCCCPGVCSPDPPSEPQHHPCVSCHSHLQHTRNDANTIACEHSSDKRYLRKAAARRQPGSTNSSSSALKCSLQDHRLTCWSVTTAVLAVWHTQQLSTPNSTHKEVHLLASSVNASGPLLGL